MISYWPVSGARRQVIPEARCPTSGPTLQQSTTTTFPRHCPKTSDVCVACYSLSSSRSRALLECVILGVCPARPACKSALAPPLRRSLPLPLASHQLPHSERTWRCEYPLEDKTSNHADAARPLCKQPGFYRSPDACHPLIRGLHSPQSSINTRITVSILAVYVGQPQLAAALY